MNERDIEKKRIFMEFYQTLDSIEFAFDKLEEVCESILSIANNFDLDNPNTYLELITPVSIHLKFLKLSITNAQDALKKYKAIEQPHKKVEENLSDICHKPSALRAKPDNTVTTQEKTAKLIADNKPLVRESIHSIEIQSLEKRISRLEIMIGTIISLLIGFCIIFWLKI